MGCQVSKSTKKQLKGKNQRAPKIVINSSDNLCNSNQKEQKNQDQNFLQIQLFPCNEQGDQEYQRNNISDEQQQQQQNIPRKYYSSDILSVNRTSAIEQSIQQSNEKIRPKTSTQISQRNYRKSLQNREGYRKYKQRYLKQKQNERMSTRSCDNTKKTEEILENKQAQSQNQSFNQQQSQETSFQLKLSRRISLGSLSDQEEKCQNQFEMLQQQINQINNNNYCSDTNNSSPLRQQQKEINTPEQSIICDNRKTKEYLSQDYSNTSSVMSIKCQQQQQGHSKKNSNTSQFSDIMSQNHRDSSQNLLSSTSLKLSPYSVQNSTSQYHNKQKLGQMSKQITSSGTQESQQIFGCSTVLSTSSNYESIIYQKKLKKQQINKQPNVKRQQYRERNNSNNNFDNFFNQNSSGNLKTINESFN